MQRDNRKRPPPSAATGETPTKGSDGEGSEDNNGCVEALTNEIDTLRENKPRHEEDHDDQQEESAACTSSNKIASAPLPEDQKVSLAIRISVATIPGAYPSEENSSRNASLHQLAEIAQLRTAQKERQRYLRSDRGLIECHADDECAIDDLQENMNTFHAELVVEFDEDILRRRRASKRRAIQLVLFILAMFVLIAGVFLGVDLQGKNQVNEVGYEQAVVPQPSSSPTIDISSCILAESVEEMSDRFLRYRASIQAEFPHFEPMFDIIQSAQREALCWIADVDIFETTDDDILQRFVLALIYDRLVKVPYTVESNLQLVDGNWLTNMHDCHWDFIKCNAEHEVERLRLGGLGLAGRLPTEIALLTKLASLDISNNQLSGELPQELWNMNQLTHLQLTGNRFAGTIPKNVTKLHQLRILEVGRNFFTGTIPSLEALTELTNLVVADNFQIEGRFPNVSTLKELEALQFSYVGLSGTLPEYLWKFTSLRTLSFLGANLSGTIPSEIGNLVNLEQFRVDGSKFSGLIPAELGSLSRLTLLDFRGNQISGTVPMEICALAASRPVLRVQVPDEIPCDCCCFA